MGLEPGTWSGYSPATTSRSKGSKPLLEALGAPAPPESTAAGPSICWFAAAAIRLPTAAWPGGSDWQRRFISWVSIRDVEDCYWSSDFFVQPTYYDPCSLVVMEALACGLPVITTAQNGASELMANGREGYVLSSPRARGELIAALEHMTDDTAPASDVGQGVSARPVSDV